MIDKIKSCKGCINANIVNKKTNDFKCDLYGTTYFTMGKPIDEYERCNQYRKIEKSEVKE